MSTEPEVTNLVAWIQTDPAHHCWIKKREQHSSLFQFHDLRKYNDRGQIYTECKDSKS